MRTIIEIENAGPKIKATNYWNSEYADHGVLFFSPNAGVIRVLVPPIAEHMIPEMKTGKKIILSRGPWPEEGREDAFELLFDDYSDSPFALHIGTEQWAIIPKLDSRWQVAVWTQHQGCVLQKKLYYRKVNKIPCLLPWGK